MTQKDTRTLCIPTKSGGEILLQFPFPLEVSDVPYIELLERYVAVLREECLGGFLEAAESEAAPVDAGAASVDDL